MPDCVRSDKEVDRILNWCVEAEDEVSNFPGMSYEQGVQAGIQWITGDTDDSPDE